MIKKLRTALLTIVSSLTLMAPAMAPATVLAQESATGPTDISRELCKGAEFDLNQGCDPADQTPANRINNVIKLIINIFSLIVGIVSVIMIIVGGLKYITSGGDSGNVTGAKNTILYAVIGLVIVALAQFIVRFVLNRVSTAGT